MVVARFVFAVFGIFRFVFVVMMMAVLANRYNLCCFGAVIVVVFVLLSILTLTLALFSLFGRMVVVGWYMNRGEHHQGTGTECEEEIASHGDVEIG